MRLFLYLYFDKYPKKGKKKQPNCEVAAIAKGNTVDRLYLLSNRRMMMNKKTLLVTKNK